MAKTESSECNIYEAILSKRERERGTPMSTATSEDLKLRELKKKLEADSIKYILVQFVDIHGSAKVKMVPVAYVDNMYYDGAGFAGGAVWGSGQLANSPDLMCRIDPDSYVAIPYQEGIARVAGDLYVDGEPHPYCPRQNLKRMLKELSDLGFTLNAGMEPEFFLVNRKEDGSIEIADEQKIDTLKKACYDYKGISQMMPVLTDINECMLKIGWGNYQTDHEDANGQYEINYDYSDALTTADRHTFIKMMTSQLALKHGYIATHMPKPFADKTGSGAHLHFSMADSNGKNIFARKDGSNDPKGLGQSDIAYHFVGGILKHAKALCAVTNPTVNCYKRLQIGSGFLTGSRSGFTWTPAFITYGDNNRTQMVRCPAPGRFEDRSFSAANNPYLAFAAYLGAGLDGIKNKIDPGVPMTGINLYDLPDEEMRKLDILPQSLSEAIKELQKDEVVQESLGPIASEFIKIKGNEWDEYHKAVSAWEIENYLTMF